MNPRRLLADATPTGSLSLFADAARVEDVDTHRRVITGTVVPYGEPGRTNLGLRAVRAGAVAFRNPLDPLVIGLYGHDPQRNETVSRLVAYENLPDRLRAQVRVARTPLGDRLLAEAAEGVRSMFSIELDGVEYGPDGDIVAGLFEFYAHVPIGAYDSARVDSVAASSHHGNGDDVNRRHLARGRSFGREFITVGGGGQPGAPAPQVATGAAPAPAAPAPAAVEPAPQLTATAAPAPAPAPTLVTVDLAQLLQLVGRPAETLTAAPSAEPSAAALLGTTGIPTPPAPAAPQLAAGATMTGQAPAAPVESAIDRAARLQAQVFQGGIEHLDQAPTALRAALADITNSDLPLFQGPSGGIGQELWEGVGYTRRFVPLMDPDALTAYKIPSWQWVTGPKVADWSGDKTQVPTNEVEVEQVWATASRCAGGWDIDRKFVDFGDAAFWAGFFRLQAESYAELSDARAAAAIVSYARDITAAGNVPASYTPLAVAQPLTPVGVLKAVGLGTAIMEDTERVRRGPDYVILNTQEWLSLIDLAALDLPAFLALMKIDPANFMHSGEVPAGSVVLGIRKASKFRELPGAAPIRVQALDVARGGVDHAVYGYTMVSQERPGGIISVPLAAEGA